MGTGLTEGSYFSLTGANGLLTMAPSMAESA